MVALREARVLVTGAPGFIGSHLTRRLVAEGADVHALTTSVSTVYPSRLLDLRKNITVHEGNLIDRTAITEISRNVRPQIVYHLGAYTHVGKSWQRIDECIQANIQGTVNLIQGLADVGYERFINFGTSEIYGDIDVPYRETDYPKPISPYSVSKYTAERYCKIFHQARGHPIVLVRPFNAFGPAQSPDRIISEVIVRAIRGQELLLTSGRQTREFNYVEDLCEGFITLATTPGIEGELFNLGCGEETSVREVTELILELLGNPIVPQFDALPDRPNEIWRMVSDSSKARERLGWKPGHTLREGMEKTIDWYRVELTRDGSSFAAD